MPALRPWRAILCGLSLLLSGCSGDATPHEGKGPALWRVEKGGLSAYLFGTIHVLPSGVNWETPAIEKAVAESDRLVLEVAGLDEEQAGSVFEQMGRSPGLPPISERVPSAQRAELHAMMARGAMDEKTLSGFESWAAGMLLSTVTQADLGLNGGSGVEPALTAHFHDNGKAIEGLEQVSDQYSAFDTMPERVQRNFLTQTVIEGKHARRQFDTMMTAWLNGDVERIAKEFDAEVAAQPELRGPLLTDRNRAWTDRIARMTGRPFVAVGAGHLAGADSLISLLRDRGFRVTRVE